MLNDKRPYEMEVTLPFTIVVTTSFKSVIALGKKISTCWAKNRTSQLQQGPEKNGLKMPNMENVQKLALAGQNKEALWGISTCWPNKCTTTIYNCNMMPKRFTKMPQNAEKKSTNWPVPGRRRELAICGISTRPPVLTWLHTACNHSLQPQVQSTMV